MQQRQINVIAKGSVYDVAESSAVMEEMLPFDSIKKYFDFQENIKRKELQLDLMNVIRGIVGANLKGIVRGALVMVLSDKVARELSWEGGIKQNRTKKYRFGDSPLQIAMFKAIKSIPAVQFSTTFEIKAIVTKGLSKAPEKVKNVEKKQEPLWVPWGFKYKGAICFPNVGAPQTVQNGRLLIEGPGIPQRNNGLVTNMVKSARVRSQIGRGYASITCSIIKDHNLSFPTSDSHKVFYGVVSPWLTTTPPTQGKRGEVGVG
ncbi:hypothetical protein OUZ56_029719 [Daphnia magna]|uniref:DUF4806 domain-containing protein n=1 Tax=Daphnia magna TaxID=35525 RepID=A0ABR0B7M6_9CRUS|nr:hypothetical protein OUZ56_029719 [Daphnia magna]